MAWQIRDALPGELDTLSALMLRSKGVHGCDAAFLELCRVELRLTEARRREERVRVALEQRALAAEPRLLGVAALALADEAELTALFVEPAELGRGIGLALWQDAIEEARRRGFASVRIESDPYALPWYLARGAVLRGETPSGSLAGRVLPWLEFDCR